MWHITVSEDFPILFLIIYAPKRPKKTAKSLQCMYVVLSFMKLQPPGTRCARYVILRRNSVFSINFRRLSDVCNRIGPSNNSKFRLDPHLGLLPIWRKLPPKATLNSTESQDTSKKVHVPNGYQATRARECTATMFHIAGNWWTYIRIVTPASRRCTSSGTNDAKGNRFANYESRWLAEDNYGWFGMPTDFAGK